MSSRTRPPHLLLIGFHLSFVRELDALLPPASLTVLEEPDVYCGKRLAASEAGLTCLREVVLVPYQQRDDYLEAIRSIQARSPITAVMPGLEYAVRPTATAADTLGLPGAGCAAADALSDKLLLRHRMSKAGLPVPRFAQVRDPQDVRAFLRLSRGSIVVKPANRQASLGVSFVDHPAQVEAAWNLLMSADEGSQIADRPMSWRYLAEEKVSGPEVSVEAFVRMGEVLFSNVTRKTTASGRHPVEVGHVLPCPLPQPQQELLDAAMRRMVEAIGFGTGVLHAEWILDSGRPILIECAGRLPGDHIFDLLRLAHERNFFHLFARLMLGQSPELPTFARRAAAIRFFHAESGKLYAVAGATDLASRPGVVEARISVRPGDWLTPLCSSWDRLGHVIAVGRTAEEADTSAKRAVGGVRFHVVGVPHQDQGSPTPGTQSEASARARTGGQGLQVPQQRE